MQIGEVGFLIRRKDGAYVTPTCNRRVILNSYSGRYKLVKRPTGRPWKTWEAATKANTETVWEERDGRRVKVTRPIGEIVMVKMMEWT